MQPVDVVQHCLGAKFTHFSIRFLQKSQRTMSNNGNWQRWGKHGKRRTNNARCQLANRCCVRAKKNINFIAFSHSANKWNYRNVHSFAKLKRYYWCTLLVARSNQMRIRSFRFCFEFDLMLRWIEAESSCCWCTNVSTLQLFAPFWYPSMWCARCAAGATASFDALCRERMEYRVKTCSHRVMACSSAMLQQHNKQVSQF